MRRRFSRVVLAVTAVAIVAIAGAATYAVAEIGGGGVIGGCLGIQRTVSCASLIRQPTVATRARRRSRGARPARRVRRATQGRKDMPGRPGPRDREGPRVRKVRREHRGREGTCGTARGNGTRKGNRAPSTLRTSKRRASRMLASQKATRTPSPLAVSSSAPARQHPVQIPNVGTVTFVCSSNTTTVSLDVPNPSTRFRYAFTSIDGDPPAYAVSGLGEGNLHIQAYSLSGTHDAVFRVHSEARRQQWPRAHPGYVVIEVAPGSHNPFSCDVSLVATIGSHGSFTGTASVQQALRGTPDARSGTLGRKGR